MNYRHLCLLKKSLIFSLFNFGTEDGVALPHGAESGFDPYQAFSDLSMDNFFGYIHGIMEARHCQKYDRILTRITFYTYDLMKILYVEN